MSNDGGPWERGDTPRPSQPPAQPPRRALGPWLAFLIALAAIVAALAKAFPQAVRGFDDWSSVAYLMGFVVVVSAGLFRAGRGGLVQHLRHAAVWMAITAVLALGYAYRADLAQVPRRLEMAARPGAPIVTGEHELVVPQDEQGGYIVFAKVNGQSVRFLVDTGASDTVLSPDDARALGVKLDGLAYENLAETANGLGHGAPYVAQSLQVGPIRLDGFEMMVNQAPMSTSLLGLSFLHRLESFEVHDRTLVLRWRAGAG
jgi:aspartyl protease family protein